MTIAKPQRASFEARTNEGTDLRVIVARLGRGTYGSVHPVADDDQTAAKIYHEDGNSTDRVRSRRRAARLRQMVELDPPYPGPHARVAWPTSTLRISEGDEVDDDQTSPERRDIDGYLMRRAPADSVDLSELAARQAGSSDARRAADLLESAAEALHDQGLVIGDVSGRNVALDGKSTLWLFDTDGWQFFDRSGRLHHAEGATERYTHPAVLDRLSGARPNCTSSRCPLWGVGHQPTASCQPREPRHDRYGIEMLARELRGA